MELLGQKRTDILKARSENHTAQLSICLKLVPLVKKLNLVDEIGFKTLSAAVVSLEIGNFC